MAGDVVGSIGLARSGGASPLPVYSGQQMSEAFAAYKQLQDALDKAIPDSIMELDGKKFRKKNYWRGVAVAFNLTVETVEERREVAGVFKDGRENFGYVVSKRATAPNGRAVMSDGTCFAVEKARRFKCPHLKPGSDRYTVHFPHSTCPDFDPEFQWRTLPGDATEHNVRGHASTRAFNRAVSDLVGFGEVSAEEVQREESHEAEPAASGRMGSGDPVEAKPSADGVTTVKGVTSKKGEKAGKKWEKWTVTFGDGRTGGTFDAALAARAQEAKATGHPVRPDIKADGAYTNLEGFSAVVKPEPVPQDEPVDGPEKVLTVRAVETDAGTRWIIQTGKRQLITDQQALADVATKAKEDKVGLLPKFDVVPSRSGGHPVNKLIEWVVAPETREPGAEG